MKLVLSLALSLAAVPALAQNRGAGVPQDTSAPPPQEIGTIQVGQTRNGMLEPGDYTMGDGTWADIWYVNAAAGQRIVVELRSRAFDAYLQLLDPWGAKLAEDDDGAGNGDARITLQVREAGRYQVVVNNFGDSPRTGPYLVSLR
jgi:hypothetical protein